MTNHHGDFIWYELMTSDADAAGDFYGKVVGWTSANSGQPDMDYRFFSSGDGSDAKDGVGGYMAITPEMAAGGARPAWVGYIKVDDVDASAAAIASAGGAVLMPAMDIDGVGRMAMVADPQGAPFYAMTGASGESSHSFAATEPKVGHCAWNELATSDPEAAKAFYGAMFGWTKDGEMDMGPTGKYQFLKASGGRFGIGAVYPKVPEDEHSHWLFYFRVVARHGVQKWLGSDGFPGVPYFCRRSAIGAGVVLEMCPVAIVNKTMRRLSMTKTFQALAACFALAILAAATTPFAINNSSRPATDIARDGARKPAAMVAFAKIVPGQTFVDMLPGNGYFTRVFAQAVGPKGKVVALVSDQYAKAVPKAATDIQALVAEPAYANVEAAIRNLGDVGAPGSVDRVWTAQNYHDLHGASLPKGTVEGLNRAIFAALKPGGMYIILDHSAAKGTGVTTVDTLHRIDAATVKAEVTSVGFTFGGESKVLANASDDRSKNVFDPAIRGKTDQFVYRFIKPAK